MLFITTLMKSRNYGLRRVEWRLPRPSHPTTGFRACSPCRATLVFDGAPARFDALGGRQKRQDFQAPNRLLKWVRRFSSAVEQWFCKPKVGSSILSTGTIRLADLAARPIRAAAKPALETFGNEYRVRHRRWLIDD